jgi:hypothetical protein
MAGFFEGVDKALTNLSQSPVGMAGMGLLMMPQQSLTPINPFEYAAQGMQRACRTGSGHRLFLHCKSASVRKTNTARWST